MFVRCTVKENVLSVQKTVMLFHQNGPSIVHSERPSLAPENK